jgi:hypothetical protein
VFAIIQITSTSEDIYQMAIEEERGREQEEKRDSTY